REPRRADAPPQLRVEIVLRQQTVGSAVRIWKDGRRAEFGGRALESADDQLEGFVPRHPREFAVAFGALPARGVEQAIWSVYAVAELADLRADVAARDRVRVAAVDGDDLSMLDRDVQCAGIWTIKRTGGLHCGCGTTK